MNVLLIDDEPRSTRALGALIDKYLEHVEILGTAHSADEGRQLIKALQPHLVFLDVEMPGKSGFDMLQEMELIDFEVIFVTGFDHYAIKAIKFAALDYLVKPVDIDELRNSIERARKKLNGRLAPSEFRELFHNLDTHKLEDNRLALPAHEGFEFVNISDIVRCEADANYTLVFLKCGSKKIVSKPLKEYERMLEEHRFFRIHHSHLINLAHVEKYLKTEGGSVMMSDGSQVYISRRKKVGFLEKMFAQ